MRFSKNSGWADAKRASGAFGPALGEGSRRSTFVFLVVRLKTIGGADANSASGASGPVLDGRSRSATFLFLVGRPKSIGWADANDVPDRSHAERHVPAAHPLWRSEL